MVAPTKYTLRAAPAVGRDIWKRCVKLSSNGPNNDVTAPMRMNIPVVLANAKGLKETSVAGALEGGDGSRLTSQPSYGRHLHQGVDVAGLRGSHAKAADR
jgi:hypothetical protein